MRRSDPQAPSRYAAGGVSGGHLLVLGLLLAGPALALFRLGGEFLPWLAAGVAGVSLVTVLLYWTDKRAAQSGRGRTPELVLHGCEALGGWPAAFLAQRLWRHKTAKVSYQVVFWLIVAAHELLAADLLFDGYVSRTVGQWLQTP